MKPSRLTLLSVLAALVFGSSLLFTFRQGTHAMPQRFAAPATTTLASEVDVPRLYLPFMGRDAPREFPPVQVARVSLGYDGSCKSDDCPVAGGDVTNISNRTVHSIILDIHVYDGEDQLLAARTTSPVLPATFPGMSNPFRVDLPNFDIPVESMHVEASIVSWSTSSLYHYEPLTVVSKQWDVTNGSGVVGEVRNDSPYPLENLQVLVIGASSEWPWALADLGKQVLEPGKTTTYSSPIFCYLCDSIRLEDIEVLAQGQVKP